MRPIKCPKCGAKINPAKAMGQSKSKKKADASRQNGIKGGRPRKSTK